MAGTELPKLSCGSLGVGPTDPLQNYLSEHKIVDYLSLLPAPPKEIIRMVDSGPYGGAFLRVPFVWWL